MTHSEYSPEALASLSVLRGSEPTPPFDATDAMWLSAFDRGRESAARDEAVVKAEAWDEAISAARAFVEEQGYPITAKRLDGTYESHSTVPWPQNPPANPYRAAALLATTTTDANDDETEG